MSVELRPGGSITVFYTIPVESPFGGTKNIEESRTLTYEEILEKFASKERKPGSKNQTPGGVFSRFASQCNKAVQTGKWSNGRDIDRDDVLQGLVDRFKALTPADRKLVTVKAKTALAEIIASKNVKPQMKKELKEMHDLLPQHEEVK